MLHLFFLPLLLAAAAAAPPSISFRLHRHLPETSSLSHLPPVQRLALASLSRASHLKNSSAPLYAHSYGGYAFPIAVGSPPQQISVLLDTGSHLSWLPCTSRYSCLNCSAAAGAVPVFHPNSSSTLRLIGCKNPSCSWIHSPATVARCSNGSTDPKKPAACPPYLIVYGSGSTAGLLVEDVLRVPGVVFPDFVVGCSLISQHQPPTGLVGFARGAPSLPSQLRINKFSYCLISRKFDDDAADSGSIFLGDGDSESDGGEALQFAPFVKNPTGTALRAFSVYYYISLRMITVGGKKVKLPATALKPNADGVGGTIIDSGTTFTYAQHSSFAAISAAFVAAFGGKYNRSSDIESSSHLSPCFVLPASTPADVALPEMVLHFGGGAKMELPAENYFVLVSISPTSESALCLAMVTNSALSGGGGESEVGPAIILGSFQQQNYYISYDLKKQRLGFRRQQCNRQ